MKNKIYHLHIAKTGGHFVKSELLDRLDISLATKGKDVKVVSAHTSWENIDDDTIIINCFRDPVKRLVSHFAYAIKEGFYSGTELTVDNFLNWAASINTYINGYQAKNLVTSGLYASWLYRDLRYNDDQTEVDKTLLYERLKRIDYNLRTDQLSKENMLDIGNEILKDFDSLPLLKNNGMVLISYNDNNTSKTLYEQLTDEQIDQLYVLCGIDTDIYFDNSLFWNNGQ